MLCDLRLGAHFDHVEKISKLFLTNSSKSYNFFYNSSKNSRGVGILFDNSLNIVIKDTYKDSMENILGFNVDIDGISVYIASVYGPNDNDKDFFNDLAGMLSKYPNIPYIIGGDWNATYSTADVRANIDIINMQSPPSRLRSGWLNDISCSFSLVDPYRALHPTRRDFTFLPKGSKKNRSRLDYFLISHNILQSVRSCTISESLACSLFDHKAVRLDFTQEKTSSK
jgi:exonuclease III